MSLLGLSLSIDSLVQLVQCPLLKPNYLFKLSRPRQLLRLEQIEDLGLGFLA